MLLRNLQTNKGHVNGARYIAESMADNVLSLPIATGNHKGNRLTLLRIPCDPGDENFPIDGFRQPQFPIRARLASTTIKTQSQSFSGAVSLDPRHECFTRGQHYVALSRTTHPRTLYVCTGRNDRPTTNVVYTSALYTQAIYNQISCMNSKGAFAGFTF